MSVSRNPDHIADDIYRDRRIRASTYCGRCGYNLRTLPHRYSCPECGQEYNARPLGHGIYLPGRARAPARGVVTVCICAVATLLLAESAFTFPVEPVPVALASLFLLLTLAVGLQTWRGLLAYRHSRRIERRIEEQKGV